MPTDDEPRIIFDPWLPITDADAIRRESRDGDI